LSQRGEKLRQIVLVAALVAGVSYVPTWWLSLPPGVEIAWKGAGVALLALYAGLSARNLDGWLITIALALSSLGDVVLDAVGALPSALTFLAADVVATALYLRNRRYALTPGQTLLALVLAPVLIAISYLLAPDPWNASYRSIYTLALALMAGTAWTSRFPLRRTGIGSLMLVAANILLFVRLGPAPHAPGINLAIWSLYFGGQTLVCLGVTETLKELGPRPLVSAF